MAKSMKSTLNSYKKQYNKSQKAWKKKTGMTFKSDSSYYKKSTPKPYSYKPKSVKPVNINAFLSEEDKKRIAENKKKVKEEANNQNTNQGCYIATCVYGSYNCPEVWTLRRFRDNILDTTWFGRLFIRCYYTISPTLVNLFGKQIWFQSFWKNKLDTWVTKLNAAGIDNTEYNDKY